MAVGIVLGILLGQFVGRNKAETQLRTLISRTGLTSPNKLMQTCMLVENKFVDSISMDSLTELVIPLMMKELDPHSEYIPARDMQAMNESLEGEFDGIGVMFNAATDTVIAVNNVITKLIFLTGSPARIAPCSSKVININSLYNSKNVATTITVTITTINTSVSVIATILPNR